METSQQTPKRPRTAIDASRGLGSSAFSIEPERARIIGHDTPHSKGEHCLWQKRAMEPVDEALAQHMAKFGFTSVIEVRKDGEFLDVVSGRRRVKAARRANEMRAEQGLELLKVKCLIVRGSDADMRRRMISENALRQDVHPLDMAEDVQGFLDMGASEEDAALSCGKPIPQLRKLLKLLDLASEVQDAIRNEELSVSAGINLADLTRDDQKAELVRMRTDTTKGGTTAAAVAAVVRARRTGGEAVQTPGKRLLTKLLASEKAEEIFGADGVKALRYAIGDLSARGITGLTDLIREVE